MHVRVAPLVLIASLALASGCASINGPRGGRIFMPPANHGAKLQFERIKSLEGQWVWSPELAPDLTGLVVTYRVTSAGSAVVETMFPGDKYEMVTVYHLDGDQLVMTHYSSAGNQPTMRAESGEPDGPIHFLYIGATNLRTMNQGHMHRTSFLAMDEGELLTSWTFYEDQKSAGDRIFRLTRMGEDQEASEETASVEATGVRADLLEESAFEGALSNDAASEDPVIDDDPVVEVPPLEDVPEVDAAEGTDATEATEELPEAATEAETEAGTEDADDGAVLDAELDGLEDELDALEDEIDEDLADEEAEEGPGR